MKLVLLAFIACVAATPLQAFERLPGSQLNGSLKGLALYTENAGGSGKDGGYFLPSGRLELRAPAIGNQTFEMALDQHLLWSNQAGSGYFAGQEQNRFLDLTHRWSRHGDGDGLLQIDRLNLHGETGELQWTLGRQAIGFGRISLFSPLDVIAPFPPDALDTDVRPGVDAVRLVQYFGLAGQLGGTVTFGEQESANSYLISFGNSLQGIDLLLLGGRLRGRTMGGVGLAGEIGGLGIRGEWCWYHGGEPSRPGSDLYERFTIAGIELWYRFAGGVNLLAEYLYNGSGGHRPEDYPAVATSAPYLEGLSYLLGRHYLLIGPSYQLHPLVNLNGLLICNLEDESFLLRPLVSISLTDNLQLDVFWNWARGEAPAAADAQVGQRTAGSEFGSGGDSGGMLLRWYF